jgi:putative nucleotidyltransferase with HDIG domain
MKIVDPDNLEAWFLNYTDGYYSGEPDLDRHVRLKQDHTLRVRENTRMLCRSLGRSAPDQRIAETVALLHDVGRFEQYRRYRTFDDRVSANHAFLGLRELAKARVLHGYTVYERRLVTRAIAYHNAITLPPFEDLRTLFFMRLIRDADKLDIWRVLLENYQRTKDEADDALVYKAPDTDHISEAVLDALRRRSQVDIRDVATLNDLKLLQLSWVYDLNFAASFRAVQKIGIIEQLLQFLPTKPSIEAVVESVVEHVAAGAQPAESPYAAKAACN